jgi:uncharacterized protein YhhL (DUF1145 family)
LACKQFTVSSFGDVSGLSLLSNLWLFYCLDLVYPLVNSMASLLAVSALFSQYMHVGNICAFKRIGLDSELRSGHAVPSGRDAQYQPAQVRRCEPVDVHMITFTFSLHMPLVHPSPTWLSIHIDIHMLALNVRRGICAPAFLAIASIIPLCCALQRFSVPMSLISTHTFPHYACLSCSTARPVAIQN